MSCFFVHPCGLAPSSRVIHLLDRVIAENKTPSTSMDYDAHGLESKPTWRVQFNGLRCGRYSLGEKTTLLGAVGYVTDNDAG